MTVLDGIRRKVGDRVQVDYAPGIRVAQRLFPSMFDMFGGNRPEDPDGFDERRRVPPRRRPRQRRRCRGRRRRRMAEHDRRGRPRGRRSSCPGRQLELLQAVVETGTPTVLLVMNGRPLDLRWAAEHVPAILDIWYPGTQGGAAVANLLFGEVSPGGQAAVQLAAHGRPGARSIYSHTRSHEPDNQARRYWDEPSTPLFPFGHGLSYGHFNYSDLAVDARSIPPDGTVTVSVQVTNTSDREAAEVVQLYLHQRYGSASRPVRELKGFQRVTVPAHSSRRCSSCSVPTSGATGARRARLGPRRLHLRRLGRRRLDRRSRTTFEVTEP